MLARIVPGVIPPTVGTASLAETTQGNINVDDLVVFGTRLSCTITVSSAPPAPSVGWRAYVSRGSTTAANDTAASSFVSLTNGTNNVVIDVPDAQRVKNQYYKIEVALTDQNGNILYPVASSNSIQLTALRWYRVRDRGIGSFSFDTTRGRCDFIVVSGGGASGPDNYANLGNGGFGVAYKNIVPPSGTFFYQLGFGSCFVRRDNDTSTDNQILGTSGQDWPSTTTGAVSSLTGIFSAPTYSTSGLDNLSGARVNGDILRFGSYFDFTLNELILRCWGDGGIPLLPFTESEILAQPGYQGTYEILYYE